MLEQHDEHFFRHQYASLVATLTRKVGVQHIALIEDAAQTSLLKAWELWKVSVPANPEAWLHRVAHNALIDTLRKQRLLTPEDHANLPLQTHEESANLAGDLDDFLHLIFVCCDKAVPQPFSLTLVLKVLCGFSVKEIAARLFISETNVYKRYRRACDVLKKRSGYFNILTLAESSERLDSVLCVLYLLFTEGYLSYSKDGAIRRELCEEAIRLAGLLASKDFCQKPVIMALLALMSFNLARLASRQSESGELLLLEEQDRSQWDAHRIAQGFHYLKLSAQGERISRYHLEAAIAAEHCRAASFAQTDWASICRSYQQLEVIQPSYLYRLNRVVALAEWQGADAGLKLLLENSPPTWMTRSYLWYVVAADIHRRCDHRDEYKRFADLALKCAPNEYVQRLIKRRFNSGG
ncbi:sigma factor [Porticoccus sp. W117]|uniref:RNA polymerase sigma factor n=1 Tax=Porticoccus sp. W117 TaxID=3054777 RepID=UPI0025933D34|nr:DUF6596 domain-containing protein [Porticoccus sp. W117]MDM3872012.1 sigma factor [Porticoccus sp. W117]